MTVIVTGATGFIGGHLVRALADAGEEVRAFVRRSGSAPIGSTEIAVNYGEASLGVRDAVFAGVHTIYHLAGATRARTDAGFHEANVETTERLLNRISRAGIRPRFVLVSSQAAAGPARSDGRPVSEQDEPGPIEAYGRSKLAGERAVLAHSSQLPVTLLRPVAVYGPGDRDFLSIFRMARMGWAVYPGIRDAVVDTVFVSDLITGMIGAARSEATIGNTYFMGSDQAVSWQTIYETAAEVVGRPVRHISIPRELVNIGGAIGDLIGRMTGAPMLLNSNKAKLAEPRFWLCSSKRAMIDFEFSPSTSLREGLHATYDWYLRHRWL